MRQVSKANIDKIEEFLADGRLDLSEYALEKDFLVFDALEIITSLPQNDYFELVFCGGTCLSKAYGLLERMSEDVDFKVVPTDVAIGLGRDSLRKRLSEYTKSIVAALEIGGFGEGAVNRCSRDENKYAALDVSFSSAFTKPTSLRANLLIELNYTRLSDSSETLSIGLLLDKLALGQYSQTKAIKCVSLREALAEKLISFPRRLAMHLSKNASSPTLDEASGWDQALVRHIYDVHQIYRKHPTVIGDLQEMTRMVSFVIEKDASDFSNQHPSFCDNPRKEISTALAWAQSSEVLQRQYDAFVIDMVYAQASSTPNFKEALGVFDSALSSILPLVNYDRLAEPR